MTLWATITAGIAGGYSSAEIVDGMRTLISAIAEFRIDTVNIKLKLPLLLIPSL